MERQLAIDHEIAAAAAPRGGVITRGRLRSLGLTDDAIDHRVRTGRLFLVYRGVYLVGHPHACGHARLWAALLSCGPGAALSHRSAAAVLEILPAPSLFHVTVPTHAGRRKRAGFRIHRSKTLTPDVLTSCDGLRVTTVARTLLDLAASEPARVVEQALDGADTARVYDQRAIDRLIQAGHPGGLRFARIVREHMTGTTITRSDLEEAMLEVCRRHGLPQPVFNLKIEGWEVDCVFAPQRLAVEVQSTRYHATPQRITRDADKEADLMAAGWQVLHVSDVQLLRRPASVARNLARLLTHLP